MKAYIVTAEVQAYGPAEILGAALTAFGAKRVAERHCRIKWDKVPAPEHAMSGVGASPLWRDVDIIVYRR